MPHQAYNTTAHSNTGHTYSYAKANAGYCILKTVFVKPISGWNFSTNKNSTVIKHEVCHELEITLWTIKNTIVTWMMNSIILTVYIFEIGPSLCQDFCFTLNQKG